MFHTVDNDFSQNYFWNLWSTKNVLSTVLKNSTYLFRERVMRGGDTKMCGRKSRLGQENGLSKLNISERYTMT